MQKKLQTEVSQLLEEVGQLAQQGEREKAYQSSLRATSLAPDEPLAWYLRSQAASSTEEQLMCLSRAYSLDPTYPETKKELRTAVTSDAGSDACSSRHAVRHSPPPANADQRTT